VTFRDEYSQQIVVNFIKQKNEAIEKFMEFKTMTMIEVQTWCKLKTLRTNNGGEFTSKKFDHFCLENSILRWLIVLYSPQQNEVVEKKNCTLVESTKNMQIYDVRITTIFWVEASYSYSCLHSK